MNQAELEQLLHELRSLPGETEWVEFKYNNTNPDEIGEYLSAISNSATLHLKTTGYIVWGIENSSHRVLGTTFRPRSQKGAGNEDLEPWLMRLLSPRIDFTIYEFKVSDLPVVMFEVQAANTTPVAFKGNRFIRVGSHKKNLKEHPEKERKLWQFLSGPDQDWSAQVCDEATLADLDAGAIAFARDKYKGKHPNLAAEVDGWDDSAFLNKVKVCIGGMITRTAIILLGKSEAEHFLSPAVAKISWILKDSEGKELDYAHFGPPFILNVEEAHKKVRNLTLRVLGAGSLYPTEISKYDDWVIREALHNCIAHQDYPRGGRINFVEQADSLLFTNLGSFIPGTVERVIERDWPEEFYRNPFMAQSDESNLNMIDTIGSGIKRMFKKAEGAAFLPMPDYDLSEPDRVKVRIIGKILDERFTRLLIAHTDLDLIDVILLDKVQKKQPIDEPAFRSLKRKGLVEGRKTSPYLSATVAAATDREAEYIHHRGSEKADCKQKVVNYLEQFGNAVRKKLEELLFPMLSTALNERQKQDFVKNLLQEMKREGLIKKSQGERSNAVWVLSKPAAEQTN